MVSTASASAKSPNPVPRTMPTSGRTLVRARTNAVDSWIRALSSPAIVSPHRAERGRDARPKIAVAQTVHLDHLNARGGTPHHPHLLPAHPVHVCDLLYHLLIRHPLTGR